jgi:hypothetical protein
MAPIINSKLSANQLASIAWPDTNDNGATRAAYEAAFCKPDHPVQ